MSLVIETCQMWMPAKQDDCGKPVYPGSRYCLAHMVAIDNVQDFEDEDMAEPSSFEELMAAYRRGEISAAQAGVFEEDL